MVDKNTVRWDYLRTCPAAQWVQGTDSPRSPWRGDADHGVQGRGTGSKLGPTAKCPCQAALGMGLWEPALHPSGLSAAMSGPGSSESTECRQKCRRTWTTAGSGVSSPGVPYLGQVLKMTRAPRFPLGGDLPVERRDAGAVRRQLWHARAQGASPASSVPGARQLPAVG